MLVKGTAKKFQTKLSGRVELLKSSELFRAKVTHYKSGLDLSLLAHGMCVCLCVCVCSPYSHIHLITTFKRSCQSRA